jgi:ligand-binding sensor domain-containing protein/signal transduction histidine kinase
MPRFPQCSRSPDGRPWPVRGNRGWGWLSGLAVFWALPAGAVILWNDPGTTLVHENGAGTDILGGAVKRDDASSDTLYFKFHVDPLSDKDTEEYFAAFELFEGDIERLGIGNSLKAWAYSAFFPADEAAATNHPDGYIDLRTTRPESPTAASYQYPRHGIGVTIVFKIQYIPGEDDLVTVWLNPDLGPGANEAAQPDELTTRFYARAGFDEIRLRHGGGGGGWRFSDLAIVTSFSDLVDASSARPNEASGSVMGGAGAYSFQIWQRDQGLMQSPVRALTQTRDGYLWLGGDDELVRFDGLRFVPFGLPEGLKFGRVSALLEDRQGALWIGSSDSGLRRWYDQRLMTLTTREGLPANAITALAEGPNGSLWIGTQAGLRLWQEGRLMDLAAALPFKGHEITALLPDRHGTLWLGVKGVGVYSHVDNAFVALTGDSLGDLLKDAHCLLMDKAERLWIGAGEDFLLCHDGDRWLRYRIPRNRTASPVTTLAEELNGTVWAGAGAGGLRQFKDGKASGNPAGAGLTGAVVESLLADREGRLWVGTDTALNCLSRRCLFALSQAEGLGFGAVQGQAEVSPGVVWVGKASDGLYRWDGKSFSRLSAAGLSPHGSQITALLVTHEGFCWVATTNSLLLYKDPIAASDEVEIIPGAPAGLTALAEDHAGTLWAGNRTGQLRQLVHNQWLAPANFHQTNAITALVPVPDGALWLGTAGNGLFRLANGAIQHVGKREGLLSEAIQTLYLDAHDTLWIGTADAGLSRWRAGQISNFTVQAGMPDNFISQILADDADGLWLGTSRGIAWVNPHRLDELAAGKIPAVFPKLYGQADGMLSENCTGGFFPAGLKTKAGLLWFSTLKGVVVVDPHAHLTTGRPPNPVLEEVLVDGLPEPLVSQPARAGDQPAKILRIIPGRHRVEFRFTGLSFEAPELMRFRYQLAGLDTDWLEAGTRRSALYSYLPPGDYQFRLAACNSDGIWNENGHALQLVVLRHFWQTWWFITLAGAGVLALVGGTVRAVVKRKLHRRLRHLEQERTLERERTRIAQDLHDEMGAKLCRISFLSEHARRGHLPPEELHRQITSISDASRDVLHSLDEIVWAVNPQNDTMEHVASYICQYAQDYFQMTGIDCELAIPAQLPPHPLSSQQRHHLFLATHEAFTNILKHSGARHARVAIVLGQAVFEIEISDDGKGFVVPAGVANQAAPDGDGLTNMLQRLKDIGGQCHIESAPGAGTRIKFVISLNVLANRVT